MAQYIAFNGVPPTTASQVVVTTGTNIKTLLQVATPSTREIRVLRWGISFEAFAAAQPVNVELIQTDVAATVTSVTPTLFGSPLGPASLCVGGAALTGHTATAEGTPTATRTGDAQLVSPTAQYVYDFVPGREFVVPISKFLRVRVKAAGAVNALCFIHWEE